MLVQADRGAEGADPTIRNKALKGDEWSAPLSASFALGEDSKLITLVAGWVSEPVWKRRNISPQPGFDRRTVQAVACRYTDYTILTSRSIITCQKLICK